jgi:hypothetical protein
VLDRRRVVLAGLLLAGTVIAGCAAGGSGPSPLAPATTAPSSATSVAVVPGTAGTVALPPFNGTTPAFAFVAGAPSGLTLSATQTTTAPSNAPAPSSLARKAEALSGATPFLYITTTFSANVPAGVLSAEVLSLASSLPTTASYFCEVDDLTTGSTGKVATYGPGVLSNGTLTISNSGTPVLLGGHTYLFQFYYLTGGPSPTPTATAHATASPTATATATATAQSTAQATATPTPTPTPTPSPTAPPTVSPTASPVPQPLYTFTGPSVSTSSITPPTQPSLTIPASGVYGVYGVSVAISWGAETSSAPFVLTADLGSQSAGDIHPSSYPFYTGGVVTPMFYLQVASSAPVVFAKTPAVTVSAATFPGANCSIWVYQNSGGGFAWSQVAVSGYPAGNVAAIPAVATSISINPGFATPLFVGC